MTNPDMPILVAAIAFCVIELFMARKFHKEGNAKVAKILLACAFVIPLVLIYVAYTPELAAKLAN